VRAAAGGDLRISNGAAISAASTSLAEDAGDAGSIAVSAGAVTLAAGAIVTSSARAGGGDVTINADFKLDLIGSQITTSVFTGAGGGGDIAIDPQFVILDNSLVQANADDGFGGNVRIVADNILVTDSIVEATSNAGLDGTINIDAPDTDASAGLAVLPSALVDAAARLAEQCAARGGRTLASFVGVGTGRVPLAPGAAVPSSYLADPGREPPAAGAPRRIGFVPATLRLACAPPG
jgi:large exoprotein involved in heme utilization and adhesion